MPRKLSHLPVHTIPLLSLSLFTIINWWRLGMVEKIAPPDFYKVYFVAEQLFSGNFRIEIIPPLFPLLLYPLGAPLTLFIDRPEAYIWAGRILSLVSGLGVIWLGWRLLNRLAPKAATPASIFLSLSPWFLKTLAFPITDMLYLLLTVAAFCLYLTPKSPLMSLPVIVAGVLTRFEGVLLIPAAMINYFRFRKKSWLLLLGAIPLTAGVFYFFSLFAPRFYAHFRDIIIPQKSYLFLLQHPLEFLNLLYGNILFFIPYSFPAIVKWTVWVLVLILFVLGLVSLFKKNKNLALALLFYELAFMISKGYVNVADPEREFRRIFSGLWLFYVIAAIGAGYLAERLGEYKKVRRIAAVALSVLFTAVMLACPAPGLLTAATALTMSAALLAWLKEFCPDRKTIILLFIVFMGFCLQSFQTAYERSEFYVSSFANKAAYAAAQWLKKLPEDKKTRIYSYTNNQMIDYYLIGTPQRQSAEILQFHAPVRYDNQFHDSFIEIFTLQLKENHIDYVIFDHYVVQKPEFVLVNDMQRMLNEQKDNRRMFRMRKDLHYRGKNVGSVLKPAHAETNH